MCVPGSSLARIFFWKCETSHTWHGAPGFTVLGTAGPRGVFPEGIRVRDMAMPLDEYRTRRQSELDNTPKALLNEAIEALLAEDTIQQRVSQARGCLEKLGRCDSESDTELVEELRGIVDGVERKIRGARGILSSEDEQELSEQLFSLYLDLSEGALIW